MLTESLPNIIIAILTCIAPIVAVIVTHSMSRIGSRKRDMHKLYRKQLFSIFEPLQILFEKHEQNVTDEFLKEVEKIIYENYSLLPLILLNEYKHVKSEKDTSIVKLGEIVASYYNFTKRMLSYPYDWKAVKDICLDQREQMFIKSQRRKGAAVAAIFLLIYIPFVIWLNNTKEIPFFMSTIMIVFVVFYIIYWAFYGIIYLLGKKPDNAMKLILDFIKNLIIRVWLAVKSFMIRINKKVVRFIRKSH